MPYRALASDFDGTLAEKGRVAHDTLAAVRRLRRAGYRFILITGREVADLEACFPALADCDLVVAENGAVVYSPESRRERLLAAAPDPALVNALRAAGAPALSVGRSIVATRRPFDRFAARAIAALGLDLEIIFNKEAVMILPRGVDKSLGLRAALAELSLEAAEVVGVGDAENDAAFLDICGWPVAVSNAVPALHSRCRHVTRAPCGEGVCELIDLLLRGGADCQPAGGRPRPLP